MQKPKYLLIDSKDRIQGTSHNFQIQLKPGIEPITSVSLCAVSLPLTNYIINSSNQNIYFDDGTAYVAQISEGVYDYITILLAIKTAMEATAYAGVITAVYDSQTFKFTISGTVPFLFTWGTNQSNSAAYILGFNNIDTASALSHTSNDVSHLSIPPYFFINIDAFSTEISTTNSDICTFVVFSQNTSGFVNFHWEKTHYKLLINGPPARNGIQYLTINLKTRGGSFFNLNNVDWQLLLHLTY